MVGYTQRRRIELFPRAYLSSDISLAVALRGGLVAHVVSGAIALARARHALGEGVVSGHAVVARAPYHVK